MLSRRFLIQSRLYTGQISKSCRVVANVRINTPNLVQVRPYAQNKIVNSVQGALKDTFKTWFGSGVNSDDVLRYWFGSDPFGHCNVKKKVKLWFGQHELDDLEIRTQYGNIMQQAGKGDLDSWQDDPHSCLALIIVLDQFSRSIYRDEPEAFQYDKKALEIAKKAVERGFDQLVPAIHRVFYYMPFQHAEDKAIQAQSVELYENLEKEMADKPISKEEKALVMQALEYARKHKVVIDKFGRFPHRNDVLNRDSTADELEFLLEHKDYDFSSTTAS